MKKLTKRQMKWIERTVANNRRYKVLLYNRILICALLLILQAVAFLALVDLLGKYGVAVQLIVGFFTVLFVLQLLGRTDAPPAKASWIILILVFPVLGVTAYFLYGQGVGRKRLLRKYARTHESLPPLPIDERVKEKEAEKGRNGAISVQLLGNGFPAYRGKVDYFPTGKALVQSMCEAVQSAKKFVLVEFFIIAGGVAWDSLLKLLLEKAMQGVKVKIIYDDFGSVLHLPPNYDRYLEGLHENIECLCFNKISPVLTLQMNHRDHRKILVVDGVVGYTGGVNLADEYVEEKVRFGYWKDTGIRLTGLAVNALTRTFLETWNTFKPFHEDYKTYFCATDEEVEEGIVQPYADSPLDRVRIGEEVYLDLIDRAEKRVYITTPYLLLDDLLRSSLLRAAKRGVDVRIVTPGIPDKKTVFRLTRANYEALLKGGVRIYEYTPGFLHAKSVLLDNAAVVGTINFDFRSLYHHFENAVYFTTPSAVAALEKDFAEIVSVSKEQTLSKRKTRVFSRLFNSALRLFEPLL